MTEWIENDVFIQGMTLAIVFSFIPLAVSMTFGLLLSVLQAATQIQEQTLTFVPKLFVVGLTLFVLGPWMLNQLIEYFISLLLFLPEVSR